MSTFKSVKYPEYVKNEKVFYDFESFLSFFKKNKNSIQSVKVSPPRLGSNHFGSVQVKIKKYVNG